MILIEELLVELTAKEIKDKYYSDISDNIFYKIVKSDPKTKIKNGNIKKIGKYSKLLLKLYRDGNLKLEDLPKATEYLEAIYKKQVGLDINKIDSLNDIYDLIKNELISDNEVDVNKLVNYLDEDSYNLKYNGDNWYIFVPNTEKAACVLGSGSQWCTAWGKHSLNPKYKDRASHFKQHHNSGPLYILINKKDNSLKYQFHFQTEQYMDSSDREINISNFLKENKEILHYFIPELKKENLDNEDIISLISKTVVPETIKDKWASTFLERNKDNKIYGSLYNGLVDDEFGKFNTYIKGFQLRDYYKNFIDIDTNDDTLFDMYSNLTRSNYDGGMEDTGEYTYSTFIEQLSNNPKLIKESFKDEGFNISDFLKWKGDNFDMYFIKELLDSYKDNITDSLDMVYSEAEMEANNNAVNTLEELAAKFIDPHEKSIRLSYLIYFIHKYKGKNLEYRHFVDMLNEDFNLPVEDYVLYEEIDNLTSNNLNIPDERLYAVYEEHSEDIVESYIEDHEDEINRFLHKDNKRVNNIGDDEFIDKKHKLYRKILKLTDGQTNFVGPNSKLRIFLNNINVINHTVYIKFEDTKRDIKIDGYIPIDYLPKYIDFDENIYKFEAELNNIIKNMGYSEYESEFENEIVKLKIDRDKINIVDGTIYIELTNKETGKKREGWVKIESLPTHFRNYKLFESLIRFKELLQ